MDDFWHQLLGYLQLACRYNALEAAKIAFQILIFLYAVAWLWQRIRATQAERLVKGIALLSIAWIGCYVMGLTMITAIMREMVPVLLIAVVVVFQPELRRGLGYLGHTGFRVDLSLADTQGGMAKEVIEQIIRAASELSRNRIGALIVVEPPGSERDYVSPGTTLNSEVSSSLLLCIFNSSSPLHDGAVVIRQNKIIADGVILPMTDGIKLSYIYFTRHRAALSLSEKYDGLCIVVSEETGAISAANRGMLVRYHTAEELADALNYMYRRLPDDEKAETQTPLQTFLQIFRSHQPRPASKSQFGVISHDSGLSGSQSGNYSGAEGIDVSEDQEKEKDSSQQEKTEKV